MLALVKKPRIEIAIQGEETEELLAWIRQKYDVAVLSTEEEEESVPVRETAFWIRMQENRIGHLLAGARLRAGLTQAQLAGRLGIRQNMISDYERGRRAVSAAMAKRLSKVLKIKQERLCVGENLGVR